MVFLFQEIKLKLALFYKEIGDNLWERFNAPKEMQAWYYSGLVDAMYEMQNYPETI